MTLPTKRFPVLAILTGVICLSGCSGTSTVAKKGRNASKNNTGQEHLDKALGYLNRADEFDRGLDFVSRLVERIGLSRAREQMLFHLSSWALNRRGDGDWERDRLLERLPPRFGLLKILRELDLMRFAPSDISFLEECGQLEGVEAGV